MVPTDLAEGDGSGTVTLGLLDASGGRGGLASGLGGELLTGSFASSGFAYGLLGTCHFIFCVNCFDEGFMESSCQSWWINDAEVGRVRGCDGATAKAKKSTKGR